MKTIIYLVLCLFSIMSYATKTTCQPVNVSILNMYPQVVILESDGQKKPILSRSGQKLTITPHYFYKRCGRIHLIFKDTKKNLMSLIAKGQTDVHIRINKNGTIEHNGLHHTGFKLKEYIEWHGLGAVLRG